MSEQAKHELLHAIARFIQRQGLVAQAMTELGLSLEDVGLYGAGAWGSTPERDLSPYEAQARAAEDPAVHNYWRIIQHAHALQLPQKGMWGEEWTYYLHGSGCLLTNVATGEPIDWDCPDVIAFDPMFFQRHLEWQLEQSESELQLAHLKAWVAAHQLFRIPVLIEELVREGHVIYGMSSSHNNGIHRYRLAPNSASTGRAEPGTCSEYHKQ